MNPADEATPWIATSAVVTSCRFQFARLNTLTFGIQTGEKFRIAFDYYAHGRLYSGEFQSPTAIPQDERIPIRYNPLKPEQNDRSASPQATTRTSLITIGVAGSIILSLLWLLLIRGCNQQ